MNSFETLNVSKIMSNNVLNTVSDKQSDNLSNVNQNVTEATITCSCSESKQTVDDKQDLLICMKCFPKNEKNRVKERIEKVMSDSSVTEGMVTIDNLLSKLGMNSRVKHMAHNYYRELTANKVFVSDSAQTKLTLAVICVHRSQLSANGTTSISRISNGICSQTEFKSVYEKVLKVLPSFDPKSKTIDELVGDALAHTSLDQREKNELEDKVQKLLEIMREFCLIEGRNPYPIIIGATFLVWKSLDLYNRRKITVNQFCNIVEVKSNTTTFQAISKLLNAVQQLVTKMSGKTNLNINRNNASVHIKEILQYWSSLMFDLNKSNRNNNRIIINKTNTKDNDVKTELIDSWTHSIKWFNDLHRKTIEKSFKSQTTSSSDKSEDISDTEINTYLRSDEEIEVIKRLKNKRLRVKI